MPSWQIWLAMYRTNLLADANWGNPANSHSTWLQPKTADSKLTWPIPLYSNFARQRFFPAYTRACKSKSLQGPIDCNLCFLHDSCFLHICQASLLQLFSFHYGPKARGIVKLIGRPLAGIKVQVPKLLGNQPGMS